MSGFVSGLQKFFTKDRLMILVIFILLAVFLLYYSTGKTTVMDSMEVGMERERVSEQSQLPSVEGKAPAQEKPCSAGYSVQQVANPSELLPNDANSQWASLNPVNQSNPQMPDLLQAGYHIGLDTIGQTMKNANQQLRSDPVISKSDTGPWNQSTIEPDLMRVPLEVGSSC
jgi:hypothetical protein